MKIFIFLLFLSFCAFAQSDRLSSNQIEKFRTGIFEIVIPKIEDTKIKYAEELPWHLVPYHLRNDKYHSIGTAFALGENYFITAAHVFSAHQETIYGDKFYLRDESGKIFKIDQILKYSNYRDAVAFSLQNPPKKKFIFKSNNKSRAGETVFTGGNALGQGVVFRSGIITSYTDEHVAGKWKYIRFSAPASPGNSGGPLLNTSGEVVGIVTMKTENENLNYALPITELKKLSKKKSVFFIDSYYEEESQKTLRYKWEFSTKLPSTLGKLMKEAQKSRLKTLFDYREKFLDKYGDQIFPNNKNLDLYRHNQSTSMFLGIIDNDANDQWGLYQDNDERTYHITPNQRLYVSRNSRFMGDYQIFVEKPEEISTKQFFANPKIAFNIFIRSLRWYRELGGAQIPMLSLGKPEKTTIYNDVYGRPWITATWEMKHSNRNFFMYCLTAPDGLACDVFLGQKHDVAYVKEGYKMNLHRIMLSYNGKIPQWEEFLKLPKKYIPTFLQDIELKNGKTFEYKIGDFEGKISQTTVNDKTELGTWIRLDTDKHEKLHIRSFYIEPNHLESDFLLISLYDAPTDKNSDFSKNNWNKKLNHLPPYHDQWYRDGNKHVLQKVLSPKGKKLEQLKAVKCSFDRFAVKKVFEKQCDDFKNGIK